MDEDLYGDLDTSTSALVKTEALQQRQRVEAENEKLRGELAVLQHENRELGERNQTLEANISSLFVTAQHELKRKDAEIQRLREELERSRRSDRRADDAPRQTHDQHQHQQKQRYRDRDSHAASRDASSSYAPPDRNGAHRHTPPPPLPRPSSRER